MAIIRIGLPTLLLRWWVVRLNPRITDMSCRRAVAEIPELMTPVGVGLPALEHGSPRQGWGWMRVLRQADWCHGTPKRVVL